MFAKEMLCEQMRLHGFGGWEKPQRFAGELDEVFENDGIMNGLMHRRAPGEWAMAGNEHPGAGEGISARKGFDDDIAGTGFVMVLDFVFAEQTGAWNGTMEIVGVGGAERREVAAALGPGSGEKAMSVGNATDVFESAIKDEMGRSVGTGVELAFDDTAGIERDDDHVLGLHDVVGNTGGFDDHQAALAVNGAGVAPGVDDEALGDQFEIGGAYLLFEIFEHRSIAGGVSDLEQSFHHVGEVASPLCRSESIVQLLVQCVKLSVNGVRLWVGSERT